MADSKVIVGFLFPLRSDLTVDDSIPKLPIYEGKNIVGRTNLLVTDKRVSRKHISLHASVDGHTEVTVEGSNPVIFKSKGGRKQLCSQEKCLITHGDILELIPGHHSFKFVLNGNQYGSSSNLISQLSNNGKRQAQDDPLSVKRHRQILEDEIFAKELQNEYAINLAHDTVFSVLKASGSKPEGSKPEISKKGVESIGDFNVSKERLSYIFRLMRVQGLPSWSNSSSVAIDDVIQGNVLVAILSNYMVDIDWLMSACPNLRKIPHVLVVHGESDGSAEQLKSCKPSNWILHKPPLPIAYGTHHSKAMFLIYSTGVRVVVHTANLIHVDWNNKTQGLWMQDFPWKDQSNSISNNRCFFENDLVDYLTTLKWPNFSVDLPAISNVNINPSFFRKFDYSDAKVRLIASVPGYHMGSNLRKWGHMKFRTILEECIFDKEFYKSPLVYQFSSLGSLDEKWLAEFASSLSSGMTSDKSPLGKGEPLIIWPTVEDVRCSIEGYRAGSCIPSPQKNVEKVFMKKYWAKWKANHTGRSRAMPHIKTYTRYNGQNLAWFLLTSANLSKAAWGALQKNNTQLMIRSYELGVLFLPSVLQKHGPVFSCTENSVLKQDDMSDNVSINTKLSTLFPNKNMNEESSEVIRLPVPYELPPQPYTSEDIPWSWDKQYMKKDVYGQTRP